MAGTIGGLVSGKEYELKLGKTFSRKKTSAFHTLRYDFKPASIDVNKPSLVEIKKNNETVVTVPHVQDGGSTTFKGGKRPCTKECILIIDKETGEITLEKLSSTLQLKKSRSETKSSKMKADLSAKLNLPQSKSLSQSTATKSSSAINSTASVKPTETVVSRTETLPSKQPSQNVPKTSDVSLMQNKSLNRKVIAEKVIPKKRNLSMSSRGSGSSSSSSDSSDSDTEEDKVMQPNAINTLNTVKPVQKFQTIQQQQRTESIPQRMPQSVPAPSNPINRPPSRPPSATGQPISQAEYLSTLDHDLHLSDSSDSD